MPRYFFHVTGADGSVSHDREGQEFPDLNAARAEAVNCNREMLGEKLLHGGMNGPRHIAIADESDQVLAIVTAADVLIENGQPRGFADDATKSAPPATTTGRNSAPE